MDQEQCISAPDHATSKIDNIRCIPDETRVIYVYKDESDGRMTDKMPIKDDTRGDV